jgi:hypothetical protein
VCDDLVTAAKGTGVRVGWQAIKQMPNPIFPRMMPLPLVFEFTVGIEEEEKTRVVARPGFVNFYLARLHNMSSHTAS